MKTPLNVYQKLLILCVLVFTANQMRAQTCSTVKDGNFSDPSTFTCTGGATSPPSLTFSGTINIGHLVSIPNGATVEIGGLTTINVSGGGQIDLGNSSSLALTNAGSVINLATVNNGIRGGNNHTTLTLGSSTCDGPFQGNQENNGNGTYIRGPKKLTQTTGCEGIVPDLTPIIYARPSPAYGTAPLTVVVDVVEINSITTDGLVTVKVTKDSKASLTFDGSLTTLQGHNVQNSEWTLTSNANYYILTTSHPINGGDKLSFGLSGHLNSGNTAGSMTCSATITERSGGEKNGNNNMDADKIDYFQQ